MKSIFVKAFPAPIPGKRAILYSLAFGLFVAAFLLFFKPYGLENADYTNKSLKIALYGPISAGVSLVFLYLLPWSLPSIFSDKRWTVGHQFGYLLLWIFSIATINGIYLNHLENLSFSWFNYGWIIINTAAVAIFPIGLLVFVEYNRLLHRHRLAAANISGKKIGTETKEKPCTIPLPDGGQFSLDMNAFLYAEAAGNYVQVYSNQEPTKRMIRISITKLTEAIQSISIQRCHRSYTVNLQYVQAVRGNAQGLRLKMGESRPEVPVSRSYIATIRDYFG